MINLGQLLGNAFHGAQQAVGNFFHPQPHPQQPQQPNLAQFLQQHIGQATQQSARQAPTVIRSINNNPIVRNIEHTFNPPQVKIATPQRQAALNIGTSAGIGPQAKAPLPTPQAKQSNPIIGTIQSIEANNPYFHQGPAPKNKAEMYAQMRDPNNPATKFALMLAQSGGDSGGAVKGAVPKNLPNPSALDRNAAIEQAQIGQMKAKQNIAATRLAHDNAMADIARSGQPQAIQNKMAQQLADQTNKDLAAHNEILGAHLADLKTLKVDPITHTPNVPQGVQPEIPKGAAYAGPNSHILNPTLKQKAVGLAKQVAEPFIDRNATPLSPLGILKDQRGSARLDLGLTGDAPIVGTTPLEPKIAPNKFTESARTSPELSAETQGIVDGTHDIKSNKILVAGQGDLLKRGLKKATASVDSAMAKPPGKISDQDVANAIAVAKAHDAKGNFEDSARILNDLSDHLVHSGRAVQAASLLERISPQGRLYAAQKQLKKAGVELTPELKGKLKEAIDNIKSFPEGSTERAYAGQQLIHFVQRQIPSSKVDKVIGIWKAGLLTGMRTQTGNMVGNAGNLAIKKAADAVAAPIDKAFSVFTGQRTKTFTLKGLGSGAAEGTKAAGKFLKTGVDERNLENLKYDHAALNYKNPALNAYVNGVFKLMGAADRPAYYSAQKNALYDLAKADGLNQGLKGSALKAHIGELVKNPTDEMAQSAVDTAEKTVFANDTLLSKIAGGIRTGASKSPLGRAAINVVMPFTKVPSSVITQVFDYTPTGAVKEIISQASKGKFDQRSMTEALGKATVGTVGVISTGIALTNADIMTGAYPKDPKEQALWKAEGKQPNSILVAGKWRSLNYLAPYGPLLGMGQNIAQASKDGSGALGGIASAVGSGVQTALGQSFLQGVQGVLDAVNDPTRYGLSTAKNMASSVIPTLVGDVAKATDGLQRQTNSIGQAIAAKIPGLREALLPQQDTLGNQIANNNSAGTTMFDPTRPTKNVTNPLFSELDRLMGTKNGVFPVNDKTIGSGKTAIKLTPEQVNQRQQQVGQIVIPLWNQIIADPKYATLDDPHKKDALQRVLTDAQTAVDRQLTTQIDPSKLTKPATGVTASILSGKGPTAQSYLNKASGAATDPASKYQTDLAKYKDDKASGKLTGPKDLAAQTKLQKEAITSKYSQDVLDFYALSKAQKNAYFKSDPQTAKSLYDQAKQLDGELTGKTGATTKFKYGLGSKPKKGRVAKITKATRTASTRINKSKVKIPKIAFAKPKPLKLAKITRSKASSGKKTTLTA